MALARLGDALQNARMYYRLSVIERAFILAGSGSVKNIPELREKLKAEGYVLNGQLYGRTLTIQLSKAIAAAKAKAAAEGEQAAVTSQQRTP